MTPRAPMRRAELPVRTRQRIKAGHDDAPERVGDPEDLGIVPGLERDRRSRGRSSISCRTTSSKYSGFPWVFSRIALRASRGIFFLPRSAASICVLPLMREGAKVQVAGLSFEFAPECDEETGPTAPPPDETRREERWATSRTSPTSDSSKAQRRLIGGVEIIPQDCRWSRGGNEANILAHRLSNARPEDLRLQVTKTISHLLVRISRTSERYGRRCGVASGSRRSSCSPEYSRPAPPSGSPSWRISPRRMPRAAPYPVGRWAS